jgi:hypothetical protein
VDDFSEFDAGDHLIVGTPHVAAKHLDETASGEMGESFSDRFAAAVFGILNHACEGFSTDVENFDDAETDESTFLDSLAFLAGHEAIAWLEEFPTEAAGHVFGAVDDGVHGFGCGGSKS